MASIREKLQRLHAPRPTEVPAPAPEQTVTKEAAPPVQPPRPPVPSKPAPPPERRTSPPAPRAVARQAPPPEPEPLPAARDERINALRSRLDRVFHPSMKAAAKRAEVASRGEMQPERSQPIREVTVVPTDEPVMRPRKRNKVEERDEQPTARRRAATRTEEPAPVARRKPLVMEPVAFEEPPRPVQRGTLAPLPVAASGMPTAETRHRWAGLRVEVMQARAENDEARALSLLHEMAALPSIDAWPHVELARYFETVAHDYERALAHIRIAVNCAAWNGGYKSQLARLESKVRRR